MPTAGFARTASKASPIAVPIALIGRPEWAGPRRRSSASSTPGLEPFRSSARSQTRRRCGVSRTLVWSCARNAERLGLAAALQEWGLIHERPEPPAMRAQGGSGGRRPRRQPAAPDHGRGTWKGTTAHPMTQRLPAPNRGAPRRQVRARSAAARPAASVGPSAELRAVIEAMPEAVLVCDPDDRIRIVNPAAERLFKVRPVRDRADLLQRFA